MILLYTVTSKREGLFMPNLHRFCTYKIYILGGTFPSLITNLLFSYTLQTCTKRDNSCISDLQLFLFTPFFTPYNRR